MELAAAAKIPEEVADIFNAPSDEEDFFGFGDDIPMETLYLEESFDSSESGKKDMHFHSKYITEELQRIFTEDTDSETEDFEGFTQNELNSPPELMLTESEMSDEDAGDRHVGSEEEEEEEEEEEAKTKTASRRNSFGLRVAFQFPTKNKADIKTRFSEPSFSSLHFDESEKSKSLRRKKNGRPAKRAVEGSTSESDEDSDLGQTDSDLGQTHSDALIKRAMNIKENKAMLAQLLAELHSLPELFPVQTPSPAYKKKPVRRAFSEGQITRRMNPTRSARPPEKFAVENFTVSPNFEEDLYAFRRRKKGSGGKCRVYRKRRMSSYRTVDEITEDDLENVAITVRDKIYDKVLGNTCHQCRQKTIDTKTVCRNLECGGVRGQFCGPCLRNRYGEDVKSALLDPDWVCPPCRGICNCSYCRRRDGRCATGILIHLAKFYGYNNVKEYLESIQKQLVEDH
ncbi:cell division cycle-associated 7-like protein isoform X1 [Antechinus flavipes]|uniref:cell division cycle-associated 7-like protein isoform X1 n=2 Tax=Antechinus flavipes TaxID=38775 RepID=UPI002235D033|nr:cell division cycle-associated 7-like protein isoform X1 [Antechinus flavipes]